MPAGIRVRNADGSLQFDSSNRLFRVLTLVDTQGVNGSVSVANVGTIAPVVQQKDADKKAPTVSVSGTTVSWTYPAGGVNDASNVLVMAY